MRRAYIVACTAHGPMSHDDAACGWTCPVCCTFLADADLFRLVVRAPRHCGPERVMVAERVMAAELMAAAQ